MTSGWTAALSTVQLKPSSSSALRSASRSMSISATLVWTAEVLVAKRPVRCCEEPFEQLGQHLVHHIVMRNLAGVPEFEPGREQVTGREDGRSSWHVPAWSPRW